MTRTIHALLIGIDEYPGPIPTLRGCVNDIDAFANYLNERFDSSTGVSLRLRTLTNVQATRRAVIEAFQEHFRTVGSNDVVLFYFSGHGSQEQSPEQFWKIEPDHLNETLVCFDSRQDGSWDLADKEFSKLIADVADRGAHVTAILDCCHSGSGTRHITLEETAVRRAPTDTRRRPIESYIVTESEAVQTASHGAKAGTSGRSLISTGRHILLAACRDNEEAKEYYGAGKTRGAFSYFLEESLRTAAGVPTYRDLFDRVSALVSSQVKLQSPQLEAIRGGDLNGEFLDGTIRPSVSTFTVNFRDGKWSMNGGAAHGLPPSNASDPVMLALYPFDASAQQLTDPAQMIAMAAIVAVEPASSRLKLVAGSDVDTKATYKAVITALPTPPLGVRLEGDAAGCALVRSMLAQAGTSSGPSLFIREATDNKPEFRLIARDGEYIITRPENDQPLVAQIEGLNDAGARLAVRRLEHIARWTQTLRLHNPVSTIKTTDVKLSILVDGQEIPDREIRLEYQLDRDDEWSPPTFTLSMTNTSQRPLFCALLDLTESFKVDAGLSPSGSVELKPNEVFWALGGEPITASVPDSLWQRGVIEFKDVLKVIICTKEFDARLLEQGELDRATRSVATRQIPRDTTLNRLLNKVQTRNLSTGRPAAIDDWQATEISFTTVRPLATSAVPTTGKSISLAGVVQVHGHSAFHANARLATTPIATRDLRNVLFPRLLIDDPTVCSPLAFSVSRGSDPALNVLELTDVVRPEAITPDAPLRLSVPFPLGKYEYVLPIASDGEFFLPLGRVENRTKSSTDIVLERLPPPMVDRRSLGGAIKIFFQKVISRVVGLDFPYPLLATADVADDGTVQVNGDVSQVRNQVRKARRIVLFIHGIIGETRTMVPGLQLARLADGGPLASQYDLVLTFDYENLNTTIEENARALKRRLEEIGLGAGHDKSVDVVAHSMGGLVARWFIEREGGNRILRKLVMLGTPNGGSPWPRVADWATLALTMGLNHVAAIAWPAQVLGGLAALIENPTVALNQMEPGSDFLKMLGDSPDPGIPYTLLAGNTSIIPAAMDAADSRKGSLLSRLLARVTSPAVLHQLTNPFFFDQPNDIAVSVRSMEAIPSGRKQDLEVLPVACDHISYFQDRAGLSALAATLTKTASVAAQATR